MAEEKVTEEQAREQARELALQIGNDEWGKGETKHAFEAYEASDITATELLKKARALLEAKKLQMQFVEDWLKEEKRGKKHSTACKRATYTFSPEAVKALSGDPKPLMDVYENCPVCRVWYPMVDDFRKKILEVLGWEEYPEGVQFRAAAVACLKMIKRMFPE